MKRFHVHLNVTNINQSVEFYNKLFAQAPSVVHDDYAKWMLDDPRVNFAISTRGQTPGLDHLGLQVESAQALAHMTEQLESAGLAVMAQGETTCCYAKSDKGWVHDPQGVAWESFVTLGESTTYGAASAEPSAQACGAPMQPTACTPTPGAKTSCC